jgi:hypothetical protein
VCLRVPLDLPDHFNGEETKPQDTRQRVPEKETAPSATQREESI